MVQIQRAEKKVVYLYLLQEGVIVLHKDFTNEPHKGTKIANIKVRLLLRSLMDRKLVDLIFCWQYFYYTLNENGKKYISEFLGLTVEVNPVTWRVDGSRNYELQGDRPRFKKTGTRPFDGDRPRREPGQGGRGSAGGAGRGGHREGTEGYKQEVQAEREEV